MQDTIRVLKRFHLVRKLRPEELLRLFGDVASEPFVEHRLLALDGNPVLGVLEGRIRASRFDDAGHEVIVTVLEAGELLVLPTPRKDRWMVECVEDGSLLRGRLEDLDAVVARDTDLASLFLLDKGASIIDAGEVR